MDIQQTDQNKLSEKQLKLKNYLISLYNLLNECSYDKDFGFTNSNFSYYRINTEAMKNYKINEMPSGIYFSYKINMDGNFVASPYSFDGPIGMNESVVKVNRFSDEDCDNLIRIAKEKIYLIYRYIDDKEREKFFRDKVDKLEENFKNFTH